MASPSRNWGHCMHCRFFGEHGASAGPSDDSERRCEQPELEEFDLVVSEASGCNHFEKAAGLMDTVEEPRYPPNLH